jgi:sugar phosphate isomerase/epimerase
MVHMSDYDFVDEKHWLPGWGDNNWNNIILSLIEAGYDGPFMYEVIKPFTSIEGLKDNYENLMNNFKGWVRNI